MLVVTIVGRAAIVKPIERGESRNDIRPGGTAARCAANNGEVARCNATDIRCNRRIGIEPSQAAARNDPAGCKAAILAAEPQVIAHGQLFIGVKPADQPIELAIKSFTLQAQFLREGVELAVSIGAWCAVKDINRAIIGVRTLACTVFTVSGDRGQRGAAQIPLNFAREAIVGGLAFKAATRRNVDRPVIAWLETGQWLAQIAQHVDDVVTIGLQRSQRGRRIVEVADERVDAAVNIDRAAAAFLPPGVIADQTDRDRVRRFEQQLPAHEHAVAVVDVDVVGVVGQEPVPANIDTVDAGSDLFADRAGDRGAQPDKIKVAIGRFAGRTEIERRLFGIDRDQAS